MNWLFQSWGNSSLKGEIISALWHQCLLLLNHSKRMHFVFNKDNKNKVIDNLGFNGVWVAHLRSVFQKKGTSVSPIAVQIKSLILFGYWKRPRVPLDILDKESERGRKTPLMSVVRLSMSSDEISLSGVSGVSGVRDTHTPTNTHTQICCNSTHTNYRKLTYVWGEMKA